MSKVVRPIANGIRHYLRRYLGYLVLFLLDVLILFFHSLLFPWSHALKNLFLYVIINYNLSRDRAWIYSCR